MNNKKPINLDLSTISFPITAVVSILHRIAGVVLFILFPFILYGFGKSLASPEMFQQAKILYSCIICKLIVWAFLSALLFHLFAGIRHIIMDLGFGESLVAGRSSSVVIFILGIISFFLLGFWVW